MKEALELGMTGMVDRVLTTGSNAIGLCLQEAPPELVEALGMHHLLSARGWRITRRCPSMISGRSHIFCGQNANQWPESMGLEKDMNVARVEI